tara:strand:- start:3452 stop:5128 length:1677 start_codon:yes stop_codon:yes gene_type:complete
MRKIFKALKFTSVILITILAIIACDADFNTLESDVIGIKNFNIDNAQLPIVAYNKKLDSVKINNLNSSLLGVFNDPAYGQTTASIITQITPATFNPVFGANAAIDSVILTIPYFNKVSANSPDADGNTVYSISDSLFGNAAIKLSVYENKYFLRDFNPNTEFNDPQSYYSFSNGVINYTDNFAITENSTIDFDSHIGSLIYENPDFIPSSDAIKTTTGKDTDTPVTTRSVPALRASLDVAFWKSAILDKEGSAELSNANNFKNYFRGLYFKAEAIGGNGNMIMLNIAGTGSSITIYYSYDSSTDATVRQNSSYVLNFTGNKVNTFINNYNLVSLENGNSTLGDDKLYLKSLGSMAVVDLFNGDVDYNGETMSTLEAFKKTYRAVDGNGDYIVKNGQFVLKKLINEAQLVVYEDETMTSPSEDYHKYDRIYAYDVKNNIPLIDYLADPTSNTSNPYNSLYIHLGQRTTDDSGISKYKIRLTEHLNNILLKDSTNTKIGLVLSTNVNYTASTNILNSKDIVTAVPSASVITPRGTILYGSSQSVPVNKRMALEVFFTDPK